MNSPNDDKILYIRVAKTGSTSIANIMPPNVIEVATSEKHLKLFGRHRYRYSFAFTRNPFDRLVSSFKMLTRSRGARDYYQVLGDRMLDITFPAFVDTLIELRENHESYGLYRKRGIHLMESRRLLGIKRRRAPLTQDVHWILSHTESIKDTLEFFLPVSQIDFIGKYENFSEDAATIKQILGIDKEIPHLGQAEDRTHFSSFYDETTENLVAELYSDDFDTFGYRKTLS